MDTHIGFVLLLMLCARCWCQVLDKARSVWVEQGLIRGSIYKIGDKYMQIFRGIPYAEPPVGKLRFSRPMKRTRWHQEYLAIEYGAPCIQFMEFHRHDKFSGPNMDNESEDCLHLNVFSPYEPEDEGKLYPVIVWLHGGSFLAGSADTGIDMEVIAKNFVFEGIAFVSVNYRLGPLGFLNYRVGEHVEGNFGIWDQVMALEWIQANMKQLNGDPSRVTVIGESAGAASASLLAVSPRTLNLVHQAVALSGSATAGWAIHRQGTPAWNAENLAAYLRCDKVINEEDMQDLLRWTGGTRSEHCNMQDALPDCIVNGGEMATPELVDCLREELNLTSFMFRRALAVELGVSKMIVDNELIPASGSQLMQQYARVPLMIGVAHSEWAHKKPQFYNLRNYGNVSVESAMAAVRKIIDDQYRMGSAQKLHNSTLELIGNATYLRYLDTPDGDWRMPRVVAKLQELEADIEFVAPAQREIDAYVASGVPVFAYSFDYVPRSSIYEEEHKAFPLFGTNTVRIVRKETQFLGEGNRSSFHGLDHAFLFTRGYTSNMQIEPYTKRDRHMSKLLTTMITNFVKHGDPTPEPWNGFTWSAYTNDSAQYAVLNLPPRMTKGSLHWPATNFWNKEAMLLETFTMQDKNLIQDAEDLSSEERLQLAAYRRAWWALWLLVAAIALLIWVCVICTVLTRCKSPRAKPYDNIVVNR